MEWWSIQTFKVTEKFWDHLDLKGREKIKTEDKQEPFGGQENPHSVKNGTYHYTSSILPMGKSEMLCSFQDHTQVKVRST